MRANRMSIIAFVLVMISGPTVFSQSFSFPTEYPVGEFPRAIAAADFNGDTYLDLAVANTGDAPTTGTDSISILFNNGDGTFATGVWYQVGVQPSAVAAADFDGDGDMDLAVSNWQSNNISVFKNNGLGVFAPAVNYVAGAAGAAPRAILAVDFDGDNFADLAFANERADSVGVLKNQGDGTFFGVVSYGVGVEPWSITAANFNNDTDIDLVTANYQSDSITVLPGNGDGTFADSVNYEAANGPRAIGAADFDGDGWVDLAVGNWLGNNVSILLNNQDGTFAAPSSYNAGGNPRGISTVELNGDAFIDLAVANYNSNNVSVLINNGDGTFAAQVGYTVGINPAAICSGDFDKDGTNDLAVTNLGSNTVSVLLNGDVNTGVAGSGNDEVLPGNVLLHQNYPNPFNPTTDIEFALAARERVSLEVYNINGQKIKQLADREFEAGTHILSWDGRDESGQPAATGVYFYRLQAGDVVESKKMVLLK